MVVVAVVVVVVVVVVAFANVVVNTSAAAASTSYQVIAILSHTQKQVSGNDKFDGAAKTHITCM